VTVADAVRAVRARTTLAPDVGVILGTGLGALAEEIRAEAAIPYADIPGFVVPTVESHAGRLLVGTLAGRRVAAMQGRFHRYEGYALRDVTFPVRVLRALGARTLAILCCSPITSTCSPITRSSASTTIATARASRT
jgi:purine-nucleoside phosphorylase